MCSPKQQRRTALSLVWWASTGGGDGVGISALDRYRGVSVYKAIIHANAVFFGEHVDGGWWMVDGGDMGRRGAWDGMAAQVPSVTHEVESRLLQGQNVVQGAIAEPQVDFNSWQLGGMDEERMRMRSRSTCWSLLAVLETSVTQS